MADKKTICVVTGSRSDWGLLEPLVAELYKKYNIQILVTGSHLSVQYGETWREIPKDWWGDCVLCPILVDWDNAIGVTKSMALALMAAPELLANLKPDLVLILGDRYEALSFSLGAYNLGVPIVHIQGTDVTEGSLDNGYRACIRSLASLHFPVEKYGSLGCVIPNGQYSRDETKEKYLVVYHPYKGDFKKDFQTILDVFKNKDAYYIASNADAGGRWINWMLGQYKLPYEKSVSRMTYIQLLHSVTALVGNSSSGLIEAPMVGIPTINIGDRQKGRLRGPSVLDCTANQRDIEGTLEKAKTITDFTCPYYKPDTITKILKGLDSYLGAV